MRHIRLYRFFRARGETLDHQLVARQGVWRIPTVAQWRTLPRIFTEGEGLILRMLLIILAVGAVLFVGGQARTHLAVIPRAGGNWREGVVGIPRLINPILATRDVDRDIARLVYSGLLRTDGEGRLVPDIAEGLTVSSDGTVYTVKLRPSVAFHDGEPLTSEDIAFTYETIQNEAWRSPYLRSLKGVGIEIVDDTTIVFRLERAYAAFPNLLTIGILPKHLWEGVDSANAERAIWNIKPIGSGPFKFKSLTKTKEGDLRSIGLVSYASDIHQSPYLKTMTFVMFPDFPSAVADLKEGRIDGLFASAGASVASDIHAKRFTTVSLALPETMTLFFNERKTFLDKDTRTALSLALDHKAVDRVIGDQGVAVGDPIPQGMIGARVTSTPYEFDPSKAQSIINKKLKARTLQEIELVTLRDSLLEGVSHAVVEGWRASGVPVKETPVNLKEFRERVRNRDFGVLLWNMLTPYDSDPFPFWHSSQIDDPGLNLSGFRNRQSDVLLEDARTTGDPEKRAKDYDAFQTLVRQELPAIFLASPRASYIVSKKLGGFQEHRVELPSDRFTRVRDWYLSRSPGWK